MTVDPPPLEDWAPPEALFDDAPIRERILDVVVGLRDPATVAEVADRVGCDPETARDYLGWFDELGIVTEHPGRPVRYERNRSYLRWRRVERIRETLADTEIVEALETTLASIEVYQQRYDAEHPDEVSLLDVEDVESTWEDLSAWHTARDRAELLDAARRRRIDPEP